jgi:hypothetical protein
LALSIGAEVGEYHLKFSVEHVLYQRVPCRIDLWFVLERGGIVDYRNAALRHPFY